MTVRIKHPFEYEIKPDKITVGSRWVTLTLRNLSKKKMARLEVTLCSLDSYLASIYGASGYLSALESDEQRSLDFRITARGSTNLYLNINGLWDDKEFCWDSPNNRLNVGETNVEILGIFALTSPYPVQGKKLVFEANIEAFKDAKELRLEFWVEDPLRKTSKLSEIEIKRLKVNSVTGYYAEMMPNMSGLFTVYAYLYKGNHRLDVKSDTVWVK